MTLVPRCSSDDALSSSGDALGKVVHGGGIHDDCQRARCRLALAFVSSTISCCVHRLHVPLLFDDSVALCLASVLWSQGAAAAARSLVVSPEWSSELAWAWPMRRLTNCRALAVCVWCLHGSCVHKWLKSRLGEAVLRVCSTLAEPQLHVEACRWHAGCARRCSRIC